MIICSYIFLTYYMRDKSGSYIIVEIGRVMIFDCILLSSYSNQKHLLGFKYFL